ncbi:MAG TPA: universal stress protein, partial [Kofleriaceae bacterium]
EKVDRELETLLDEVDCDVAMLRAPDEWRIGNAKRVLVPLAGKSDEHELRVRLLATISREAPRELVFLTVVPANATDDDVAAATKVLGRLSRMKIPGTVAVEVMRDDDPAAAIIAEAARCDLVVLGMRTSRSGAKQVGTINKRIAAQATCAVMLLSRRQQAQVTDLIQPIRDVANIMPLPFLAKRGTDDD